MMSITVAEKILDSALKRPEAERAHIAEALLASLEAPLDREIWHAWQKEIDRRLNDIDSGAVNCTPWEEVKKRLYRNAKVQR
ncbi:MAG: addiction module protein [Candidatus Electrothrix sp. GW3-4]|uniref:addiction module protein n=1 Tax=Candidatus Electrothrix sp. GW3-4 TaxID=3126740 RepID=UPI0030CD6E30